jgi:hypothetical protein
MAVSRSNAQSGAHVISGTNTDRDARAQSKEGCRLGR